jgi:hypothetical protein
VTAPDLTPDQWPADPSHGDRCAWCNAPERHRGTSAWIVHRADCAWLRQHRQEQP